ncbi:MAG: hypothetical protein LKE20_05175 [Limosilactobacillus oris]|uniref:hypothetical protein n=1 Tax=Limosilactobacillus oris TaxID=1632 RepID=UPI00242FB04B|nr:hypothetical protein [Limosilactobacillus oris]MCH3911503.1 hypothetical protein [Limosilactobacillus oris]MCH3938753.1 hypothetical protein [Limosilactobacillus oris]MCI1980119.1 hypothetical protein [Limosilactobacillus oris]MCI2042877.1 hypothetical protein [Limosilactobacillus oris]
MSRLGFHSISDIETMTLREYYLRLEAYQLHEIDVQEKIALQAFYNQSVQETTGKKHPRPKYRKFKQFFDREEQELAVRNVFADDTMGISEKAKRHTQTELFMRRAQEFKKLREQGKIDMNAWKRAGINAGGD